MRFVSGVLIGRCASGVDVARGRSGHRLAKSRRCVRPQGGGIRRCPSLRISAHRSHRHARRRDDQAGAGARRLGRFQADARRSHGDGRSRLARNRDQSRDGKADRERRFEITAVHNHLLRANPATFYMHVGGHGDPVKMATAIQTALAESKTPLEPPAAAAAAAGHRPRYRAARSDHRRPRARTMAAFINSACRAATRSRKAE